MSQENRRRFLQFLAASPLAGTAGHGWAQLPPKPRVSGPAMWAPLEPDQPIKGPKDAINVFEFEPVVRQLYSSKKWAVARGRVTRAEKAGCPVVAVPVDRSGGRNQETLFRLQRTDSRDCSGCHDRSSFAANMKRRSMYQGLDLSGLTHTQSSAMTWDFLKRLRATTKMKIVLKGILAPDDALLAVHY